MTPFFLPQAQRQAVTESKNKKHSSGVVLRRARYCIAVAFWTVRHRSYSRGVWVATFEGYSWN
jgi:hypothetical protein